MKKSESYMELCMHLDGQENVYLRIPTVWDDVDKKWRGFTKTPQSNRLIHGEGKTSFELQNSFNKAMRQMIEESDELAEEILAMFMPAFYWQDK